MNTSELQPWQQPTLMTGLTLYRAHQERPFLFHQRPSIRMRLHWKIREIRRHLRAWIRHSVAPWLRP